MGEVPAQRVPAPIGTVPMIGGTNMQWINQGADTKKVYAFRPNTHQGDLDEWFFVAETLGELMDKQEKAEEVSADQCGACGSWVPCEASDPGAERNDEGTYLRPARYTVTPDGIRCDCGAVYRVAAKYENDVIF